MFLRASSSYFPGLDVSSSSRLSPTVARQLLKILQKKDWYVGVERWADVMTVPPHHSSNVIAVDEQGNVAALVHSCNCLFWGTTGIFVDGISVP